MGKISKNIIDTKNNTKKMATENLIPLLNNIKRRKPDRWRYVPKTFFSGRNYKKCNNSYI